MICFISDNLIEIFLFLPYSFKQHLKKFKTMKSIINQLSIFNTVNSSTSKENKKKIAKSTISKFKSYSLTEKSKNVLKGGVVAVDISGF